jgi:hypothetical protein
LETARKGVQAVGVEVSVGELVDVCVGVDVGLDEGEDDWVSRVGVVLEVAVGEVPPTVGVDPLVPVGATVCDEPSVGMSEADSEALAEAESEGDSVGLW